MDVSSRKDLWACFDFLNAGERKQKLILGLEAPDFNQMPELGLDEKIKIVPRQRDAIQKAISAKDYFLIQGPPGTGKTTLLVHLIKEMLKDPNERILVTAFTNRAVDEIIGKMLIETDLKETIIRLGGELSTEHPEYSLQRQIEQVPEKDVPEFLKLKRVYFSTIASASYHEIFSFLQFTTAIIDEASQLTEPDTLSIILNTKRFILIGDEKQLPAVISQGNNERNIVSIETNNKILNEIGIRRLDCSLFERLVRCNEMNGWDGKILLDKQYRMNDDILRFSNQRFYNSSLTSDESNANSRIEIPGEMEIVNNIPIEFYNVKGYGEKKKNKFEVNLLIRLLEEYHKIIQKNNLNISLGIITPFRAQVSLINQELLMRGLENIKVDTVERFQGSEKDMIFISFAAYHHSQIPQIQSLIKFGDKVIDRKLNVALTRAKKKLIMIGNAELLSKNEIFRKLIDHSKEYGKFIDV
jgi:DNA replication ATP-dependent helicase Dna2